MRLQLRFERGRFGRRQWLGRNLLPQFFDRLRLWQCYWLGAGRADLQNAVTAVGPAAQALGEIVTVDAVQCAQYQACDLVRMLQGTFTQRGVVQAAYPVGEIRRTVLLQHAFGCLAQLGALGLDVLCREAMLTHARRLAQQSRQALFMGLALQAGRQAEHTAAPADLGFHGRKAGDLVGQRLAAQLLVEQAQGHTFDQAFAYAQAVVAAAIRLVQAPEHDHAVGATLAVLHAKHFQVLVQRQFQVLTRWQRLAGKGAEMLFDQRLHLLYIEVTDDVQHHRCRLIPALLKGLELLQ